MQKISKSCLTAIASAMIIAAWPVGCASWSGHDAREIDSALLTQPPAYAVASLDPNIAYPHQATPLRIAQAPVATAPAHSGVAPTPSHNGHAATDGHGVAAHQAAPAVTIPQIPQAAATSLESLRAGNLRFVSDKHSASHLGMARRQELTTGQQPFAAILCCSDSRVPPEIVFDQGLGDIFIIRVAGNVADPDVTASVEYAIEHLHTPLVVVMGHSQCGAVKATVEGGEAPGSIGELVAKIKPSVEKARAEGSTDKTQILGRAIDENVKHWVEELKKSPVVKELEHEGKVYVTGARYDLETGRVDWFK